MVVSSEPKLSQLQHLLPQIGKTAGIITDNLIVTLHKYEVYTSGKPKIPLTRRPKANRAP